MDKTVAVFLAASILCAVQVFVAQAGVEPDSIGIDDGTMEGNFPAESG